MDELCFPPMRGTEGQHLHTPGPWRIGCYGGSCKKAHDGIKWHPGPNHPTDPCVYEPHFMEGGQSIAGPDGVMVVRSHENGAIPNDADVELISAAPELLAFAQWFLANRDGPGGKMAREAVAKAMGQSPQEVPRVRGKHESEP